MNKLLTFLLILVSINILAQTNEILIQKQINELHIKTKKTQDSIYVLIKAQDALIEKSSDSIAKHKLNKELTHQWEVVDRSLREEVLNDINFAMQHPESHYCLLLVKRRMQRQEGLGYYEKYKEVYENFTPIIKASKEGKDMAEKLKYFKQSMVGSVAPYFTFKDINGNELSLENFKNKKFVLLDFWASWCAPCLEDQKYLKPIYAKFKDYGFEIISISNDTDIEKWKRTVTKKKIDVWKNICVISKTSYCGAEITITEPTNSNSEHSLNTTYNIVDENNSVQKDYFVSGIPHYVLIDKNGIIVGKWKGSGELNMQALENTLTEFLSPD